MTSDFKGGGEGGSKMTNNIINVPLCKSFNNLSTIVLVCWLN